MRNVAQVTAEKEALKECNTNNEAALSYRGASSADVLSERDFGHMLLRHNLGEKRAIDGLSPPALPIGPL